MKRRLVGGPMDGETIDSAADVLELDEAPGMAYHRTHLAIDPPDLQWWEHGKDHAPRSETVYEWHERDWVSPVVAAIREALDSA